jgi:hypothetical protein
VGDIFETGAGRKPLLVVRNGAGIKEGSHDPAVRAGDVVVVAVWTGEFVVGTCSTEMNPLGELHLFEKLHDAKDCGEIGLYPSLGYPSFDFIKIQWGVGVHEDLQDLLPCLGHSQTCSTQFINQKLNRVSMIGTARCV